MSAFKRRAPAASAPDASQNVANRPKGTKVSAYNGSLLLSTGLASLDDILGGGLPLGSLCLLHQDLISTYSKLVLKFFTAQGLVSGQTCALWSDEADITEQLPGLDTPTSKPSSSSQNELTSHDMKIAFNYANLGKFQRSVENEPPQPGSEVDYCSNFDLTQQLSMDKDMSSRLHTSALDPDLSPENLFKQISQLVKGRAATAAPMRMVIHAVGSPYASLSWSPSATCRFLHSLRHLLRSSNTTALVTIPAHLHPTHIVNQYHHASDAVLHFQSFAAHPELAAQFPRYNGLVHVLRLPTTSSMVPPSTKLSVLRGLATQKGGAGGAGGAGGMENNLAFRVKRRKFAIETLHLDVGGGSNERQTPDNSKNQAKEEVQIVRDDAQHQPPKKTFGSKTASSKRPISTNPAEAW